MSAEDAAIYMRALLAGTIPGVSAEGLKAIFSDQVSSPAGTNPMGLIFYGNAIDGTASMGHAGDTIAFHSDMILYPVAKVGLFVSYNSVGGPKARAELQRLFVERYLHTPTPDLGAAPNAGEIAAQMTGTWASSRRADDTLIAIAGLIGQVTIQGNRDGSLSIEGARDALGQPQTYLPSGPGGWRPGAFGGHRVAMANADGKLVGLTGAYPVEQRQRVPAYDSKSVVLPVMGGSVVVLILLIIGMPALGIIKQLYRVPRPRHPTIRLDWGLIYVTSLIQMVMVGGIATIFIRATDDPTILNDALDPYLIAINGAGWLATAFSLVLAWSMMKAWANSAGHVMPRLYFSLACLSSLALSGIAIRWHLIGTSLIY
jgi:hypothetical protein